MQKMAPANEQYVNLVNEIVSSGESNSGRNGKVFTVYNKMLTFNSTPLVSIRRTAWKNALREMQWFLSGSNNINDLHTSVRHWWSPWADESGVIFANYGEQLRRFNGNFDQISHVVNQIKTDPKSRRHVLTTWHSQDMANPKLPLANCHGSLITLNVTASNRLDVLMVQRSVDVMLGLPHNLLQYWAFMLWMCSLTGTRPGNLTWVGSNVHIYEPHIEAASDIVKTYLTDPKLVKENTLLYKPASQDFIADDFELNDPYFPALTKSLSLIV